MPSQASSFITPSKKQTTHQKLHLISTPTTFAPVTTNLLGKLQAEANKEDPNTLVDVKPPDLFIKIKLPDSFSNKDKDALIKELVIQEYTATFASESACKKSSHYFSYRDINTQHSNDIKPTVRKIKDKKDSFLHGLFQFHHACEQLHGWESAT